MSEYICYRIDRDGKAALVHCPEEMFSEQEKAEMERVFNEGLDNAARIWAEMDGS